MKKILLLTALFLTNIVFAGTVYFTKKNIKLQNKKISVELATTSAQHEQGLMFRTHLADNSGMLFVFKDTEIRNFWMKNTFIPLSIGYFDDQKKLLETFDMEPVKSEISQNPKVYPSTLPAKYALEMPLGWFKKNNIKVGDQLHIP